MKTKDEAKADLLDLIPRGATVYSVTRHTSRSNMAGWYSFACIVPHQGESRKEEQRPALLHPNYAIGVLTGRRAAEKNGYFCIRVGGCGYNRPAAVVADLAQELYGDPNALRHESI